VRLSPVGRTSERSIQVTPEANVLTTAPIQTPSNNKDINTRRFIIFICKTILKWTGSVELSLLTESNAAFDLNQKRDVTNLADVVVENSADAGARIDAVEHGPDDDKKSSKPSKTSPKGHSDNHSDKKKKPKNSYPKPPKAPKGESRLCLCDCTKLIDLSACNRKWGFGKSEQRATSSCSRRRRELR
jgi:hypothetical protein